jgi:hypothetical protein
MDTVGCDLYLRVIKRLVETPCILECCAKHDKCYHDLGCSSGSFFSPNAGCSHFCSGCNGQVMMCFQNCGTYSLDDTSAPNYYCGKLGRYVEIPGDEFGNLAEAEEACKADYTEKCCKKGPPPPPPPCRGWGCLDNR